MKAIQHHLYGLKITFETLSKGKLLLFFLPGILVGLFYFWAFASLTEIQESAKSMKDIWLVGGMVSGAVDGALSFGQTFLLIVFQFVVLTLLSPFNSVLSEKFDTEISGRKFDGGLIRILNDFLRMILVVILSLLLEFFLIGVWWIISFIPVIGSLSPLAYFIISSFFFGFAFFDYSLERHGVGTLSSLGFAFRKFWHMVATGGIFMLLFKIPVAGVILAPVLCTMISTAVYVKMHEKPVASPENALKQ